MGKLIKLINNSHWSSIIVFQAVLNNTSSGNLNKWHITFAPSGTFHCSVKKAWLLCDGVWGDFSNIKHEAGDANSLTGQRLGGRDG